jgi:hypothetical protein
MDSEVILELGAMVIIAVTVLSVICSRLKSGKGIGMRAIQFVAVPTVPAFLPILGLEHLIDGLAIAAIIGGIACYAFAKPSTSKEDD